MENSLNTSLWIVISPDGEERIGTVGAYGATEGSATVRITLELDKLGPVQEDDTLTIELPEEWASVLAEHITKVVIQMEHLRVLYRHGKLATRTLDDSGEN